jgi:hypothetical protein
MVGNNTLNRMCRWWMAVLIILFLTGCFHNDDNGVVVDDSNGDPVDDSNGDPVDDSNGDPVDTGFQGIVFLGDMEIAGTPEAFAVNFAGTSNTKLSGTLVTGGRVRSVSISPDRQKVAYVADQDIHDVLELYVVNPDGTDNTKVSGTLVLDGNVQYYRWAHRMGVSWHTLPIRTPITFLSCILSTLTAPIIPKSMAPWLQEATVLVTSAGPRMAVSWFI